jgi:hypothetical protein
MTRDDVHALADEVLRPILGPVGFAFSEVEERENSVGEDAFYVTVHMTPETEYVRSPAYTEALVAMQDALAERGERRFAYFRYDFPSDPPPSADDEEV